MIVLKEKINDSHLAIIYLVNLNLSISDSASFIVQSNEIAFIDLAGHSVPYKNRTLIDSWDCQKKSISNYWTKEADFETSLDKINNVIQRIKL